MVSSDLDFSPGLHLQEEVLVKSGTSISFPSPSLSPGFVLVASFSHSTIRINVESVALILQSCVGGQATDFWVQVLSGWCFRFVVCSKDVGFWTSSLKSFSCKSFGVHSSLWSNGGPNWKREYAIWMDLQGHEWTTVELCICSATFSCQKSFSAAFSFSKAQFPSDYQDNYKDEISQFVGHGTHQIDDLRPNSVFKRLAYPSSSHQNHVNQGSVLHQTCVHHRSPCPNFEQGQNWGGGSPKIQQLMMWVFSHLEELNLF
jgi:hypothetical protein